MIKYFFCVGVILILIRHAACKFVWSSVCLHFVNTIKFYLFIFSDDADRNKPQNGEKN